MSEQDLILEFIEKKNSIDELSNVINKYISNVVEVRYEVFKHDNGYYQEYIVMTYRGGAIAVRNVNINSISANFDETIKLTHGGYYEEVATYRKLKEDPKWTKLLLNK